VIVSCWIVFAVYWIASARALKTTAVRRIVRFDPSSDDVPPQLGMPGDENKRFRLTAYVHAFNVFNRINPAAPGRRLEAGVTLGF
jgi:hypothetical protein